MWLEDSETKVTVPGVCSRLVECHTVQYTGGAWVWCGEGGGGVQYSSGGGM